jgi:hypothetical protein
LLTDPGRIMDVDNSNLIKSVLAAEIKDKGCLRIAVVAIKPGVARIRT